MASETRIAATLDEGGHIAADTPCRACGYNLRGLPRDGRCPECGTAVELSLRGDLLRYADPTWAAKIEQGAGLWLSAMLLVPLMVGALLVGAIVVSPAVIVALVGYGSCHVMQFAGLWLLATPDPSGAGETEYGRERRLVRGTLIGQVVAVALLVVDLGPSGLTGAARLVFLAGAVLAGEYARYALLEGLARRLPSRETVQQARLLKWILPGLLGVPAAGFICGVLLAWVGVRPNDSLAGWGLCAGGAAIVAYAVAQFAAASQLLRFQRIVRREAAIGVALWEEAVAAPPGGERGTPT